MRIIYQISQLKERVDLLERTRSNQLQERINWLEAQKDILLQRIVKLELEQNVANEKLDELYKREFPLNCIHPGSYIDSSGWHCPVCKEHRPIGAKPDRVGGP